MSLTSHDKRDVGYVLAAFILMSGGLFFCTLVHELGHAVTAVLLDVEITEFVISFDGGHINIIVDIQDPFYRGIVVTVIRISGGLAAALFFVLLGYFKRPFLILVPLYIMDGLAEVFTMNILRSNLGIIHDMTVVFIIGYIICKRMWRDERP